jgi:hyperosmotically inducible protein
MTEVSMKRIVTSLALLLAITAAGCDRPIQSSAYNNSGASATGGNPATTTSTTSTTSVTPAPGSSDSATPATTTGATGGTNVVSDTVTTGKVKAAIAADSGMKDTDVSVTTQGGVVILSGTVKSQDQLTIATNLAQRQDGVSKVETTVTVR